MEDQIDVLGLVLDYSFTAFAPAVGALCPLRDPDSLELDEEEEE
ncbi:hypothetical protein [Streptomyces sp. NPDC087300]